MTHFGLRESLVSNTTINVGDDVPSVATASQDQTTQLDKDLLVTSDSANGLVESTDVDSGIGSPARNTTLCSVLEEDGINKLS